MLYSRPLLVADFIHRSVSPNLKPLIYPSPFLWYMGLLFHDPFHADLGTQSGMLSTELPAALNANNNHL